MFSFVYVQFVVLCVCNVVFRCLRCGMIGLRGVCRVGVCVELGMCCCVRFVLRCVCVLFCCGLFGGC